MIRRLSLTLALLLVSSVVMARPTTQEYQLAPTDCDGNPVSLSDYSVIEFYIDDVPIPVQATDPCSVDSSGVAIDVPPAGATALPPINAAEGSITFDLDPGHWYARARARDVEGNWSNLSSQLELTVPSGIPRPPIMIRWEL